MKKKYLYLDTCILNKMAYISNYDYILKKMKKAGYIICISEITILEILKDTNDKYNVEKILQMLQSVGSINLLPSISTIVSCFLEHKPLILELNNNDKLILDVLYNKELTFIVNDESNLNKAKEFYKEFNKMIKSIKVCDSCSEFYCDKRVNKATELFVLTILLQFPFFMDNIQLNKLCTKLDLNNSENIGTYINNNYNYLIENEFSPFKMMGRMAILQKNKLSNGTFNDCLQMIYLPFIDYFISDDKNLLDNIENCISFNELMESVNLKIEWEEQ